MHIFLPSLRRALATASISLLSVTVVPIVFNASSSTLPLAAAASCDNPQFTITGGEVRWGMKQSFRSYILGKIAEGSWETSNGAGFTGGQTDADGAFTFPVTAGSGTASDLAVETQGSVHLRGHNHQVGNTSETLDFLDSTFSNISVHMTSETTGELIGDFDGNIVANANYSERPEHVSRAGLTLATLTFPTSLIDGQGTITGEASLTQDGNAIGFSNFYEAGDTVDPVTLSLQGTAQCGDGSSVTLQGASSQGSGSSSSTTSNMTSGSTSSTGEILTVPERPTVAETKRTIVESGSTITMQGSGFAPNSQVALRFAEDTTDIAYTTADDTGHASITFTIPKELGYGTSSYSLAGTNAQGEAHTAVLNIRIIASQGFDTFMENLNVVTDGMIEGHRFFAATNNIFVSANKALNAIDSLAVTLGFDHFLPSIKDAQQATALAAAAKVSTTEATATVVKPATTTSTSTGGSGGSSTTSAYTSTDTTNTSSATTSANTTAAVCSLSDAQGIASAELGWGFKESFRAYISGSIAQGGWDLNGTHYTNGNFVFSGKNGAVTTTNGAVSFTGSVHFTGHNGVLDLTIADPEIQWDGSEGVLLATVNTSNVDGVKSALGRIPIANLSVQTSIDGHQLTGTATTSLTESGATAFADFYEPGIALDPLTFTATLANGANCGNTSTDAASSSTATSEALPTEGSTSGSSSYGGNTNGKTSKTSLLDDDNIEPANQSVSLALAQNPTTPLAGVLLLIAIVGGGIYLWRNPRNRRIQRSHNNDAE